jgi:hypothetical protein
MTPIDLKIREDLLKIHDQFNGYIIKIGLFGSILEKILNEINDIDVLILYRGISYNRLKSRLLKMKLNYPIYPAYLNVSYIPAEKKDSDPLGYHIILMPIDNPCIDFLKRHEEKIQYITSQKLHEETVGTV